MDIRRIARHMFVPSWWTRRLFPASAMRQIESAIRDCESRHAGQIRFAVEPNLDFIAVARGMTARERAIDVFSQQRIWDTEHNNGVLIYLLLADRDVEIIADRGIHARTGAGEWERICRAMEQMLQHEKHAEAVIMGINEIGAHLERHYPKTGRAPNELSDVPIIL